jgi:hypothetical protein
MTDITKAIKGASLTVWDEKIPGNAHWDKHGLLDSSATNEKFNRYRYHISLRKTSHYARKK